MIRRTGFVGVAFAVFGLISNFAFESMGQSADEGGESIEPFVYVWEDVPANAIAGHPAGLIPVKRTELSALLKKLSPSLSPKIFHVPESLEISLGLPRQGLVAGTLTMKSTRSGRKWTRIGMKDWRVTSLRRETLIPIRSNDSEAREEPFSDVGLDPTGENVVEIEEGASQFNLSGIGNPDGSSIRFVLGSLAASRITLSCDVPSNFDLIVVGGAEVTKNDATASSTGNLTRRFELIPFAPIELVYRQSQEVAFDERPSFRETVSYRANQGLIETEVSWRLMENSKEISFVDVIVPENSQVLSAKVNGLAMRALRGDQSGVRRFLFPPKGATTTVRPDDVGTDDNQKTSVSFSCVASMKDEWISLPRLRTPSLKWIHGSASLSFSPAERLADLDAPGARLKFNETASSAQIAAYSLALFDENWTLRVRTQTLPTTASVTSATAVEFATDQVRGKHIAEWRGEQGETTEVNATVAPGWVIENVSTEPPEALLDWAPEHDGSNERLTVHFRRALPRDTPIRVVIQGRLVSPELAFVASTNVRFVSWQEEAWKRNLVAVTSTAPLFEMEFDDLPRLKLTDALPASDAALFSQPVSAPIVIDEPWRRAPSVHIRPQRATYRANTILTAEVRANEIRYGAKLNATIVEGALDRLDVRVVPGISRSTIWRFSDRRMTLTATPANPDDPQEWIEDWRFQFGSIRSSSAQRPIEMDAEWSMPLGASRQVHLLECADALEQTNDLDIRAADRHELSLDSQNVEFAPRPAPNGGALIRYSLRKNSTVRVLPYSERLTPLVVAERAKLQSYYLSSTHRIDEVTYELFAKEATQLEVILPARSQLLLAELNKESILRPADASRGKVSLAIPTGPVTVTLRFSRPQSAWSFAQLAISDWPTVDIPIAKREWLIVTSDKVIPFTPTNRVDAESLMNATDATSRVWDLAPGIPFEKGSVTVRRISQVANTNAAEDTADWVSIGRQSILLKSPGEWLFVMDASFLRLLEWGAFLVAWASATSRTRIGHICIVLMAILSALGVCFDPLGELRLLGFTISGTIFGVLSAIALPMARRRRAPTARSESERSWKTARSLIWVSIIAVSLAGVGAAHGEDTKKSTTKEVARFINPIDDSGKPVGEYAYLSNGSFSKLQSLAERADAPDQAWVARGAEWTLRFVRGTAIGKWTPRLFLKLRLEVLEPQARLEWPIDPGSGEILSVEINDEPIQVAKTTPTSLPKRTIPIPFPRTGLATVTIQFDPLVGHQLGRDTISVPAIPSANSTLSIDSSLMTGAPSVDWPTKAIPRSSELGFADWLLAPSNRISVSWPATGSGAADVDELIWFEVQAGGVVARQLWKSPTGPLSFEEAYFEEGISPAEPRDSSSSFDATKRLLWMTPRWSGSSLLFGTQFKVDRAGFPEQLSLTRGVLQRRNVRNTWLAISLPSDLECDLPRTWKSRSIAPAEVLANWNVREALPPNLAFDLAREDTRQNLTIRTKTSRTLVDQDAAVLIGESRSEIRFAATLRTVGSSTHKQRIRVPKSLSGVSVEWREAAEAKRARWFRTGEEEITVFTGSEEKESTLELKGFIYHSVESGLTPPVRAPRICVLDAAVVGDRFAVSRQSEVRVEIKEARGFELLENDKRRLAVKDAWSVARFAGSPSAPALDRWIDLTIERQTESHERLADLRILQNGREWFTELRISPNEGSSLPEELVILAPGTLGNPSIESPKGASISNLLSTGGQRLWRVRPGTEPRESTEEVILRAPMSISSESQLMIPWLRWASGDPLVRSVRVPSRARDRKIEWQTQGLGAPAETASSDSNEEETLLFQAPVGEYFGAAITKEIEQKAPRVWLADYEIWRVNRGDLWIHSSFWMEDATHAPVVLNVPPRSTLINVRRGAEACVGVRRIADRLEIPPSTLEIPQEIAVDLVIPEIRGPEAPSEETRWGAASRSEGETILPTIVGGDVSRSIISGAVEIETTTMPSGKWRHASEVRREIAADILDRVSNESAGLRRQDSLAIWHADWKRYISERNLASTSDETSQAHSLWQLSDAFAQTIVAPPTPDSDLGESRMRSLHSSKLAANDLGFVVEGAPISPLRWTWRDENSAVDLLRRVPFALLVLIVLIALWGMSPASDLLNQDFNPWRPAYFAVVGLFLAAIGNPAWIGWTIVVTSVVAAWRGPNVEEAD